ncbi:unnamed protein product, partial [Rotaria sp. Silwood2]
ERPELPRFRDDLATGINVVTVELDAAVTDEDDDVDDDDLVRGFRSRTVA